MLNRLSTVIYCVAWSVPIFHIGEMLSFRNRCGKIVTWTHSPNWLRYMAHKMLLWISEIYYVLFNCFPERLNGDSLLPSIKLNQADGEFLLELLLVIWGDAIISLSSWFMKCPVSAKLHGLASISASNRRIWNCSSQMAIIFATLSALSSVAVFLRVSSLENILLGLVALVPNSCNSCRSWCRNIYYNSLHFTGVTWWILHTNHSIALRWSRSDQVIVTCWALFGHTWNCLHFDVEQFSAPYKMAHIALRMVYIFCSRNWLDSIANTSFTATFTDFDIFWFQKIPFF